MAQQAEQWTRDTMPASPDNTVRLLDGVVPDDLRTVVTLVASGAGALHGYPTVTLRHETRGFVCAGSCSRWQEARWSVTWWEANGTRHGRTFLEANEGAARAYFADVTDPQKVSAMRQADARRADEEREIAARVAKMADAVMIEAAKTYRSGWQWRAPMAGVAEWCGFAKTKAGALAEGRKSVEHEFRRTLIAAECVA